jgi:hypothetical protein
MIYITGLGDERDVKSTRLWDLPLARTLEGEPAPRRQRQFLPRPLRAGQTLIKSVTSVCSLFAPARKTGSSNQARGEPSPILNNIQPVLDRARAEFSNAPDLHVSVEHMQRLCGVDRETAEIVLDFLVDTKFLARTSTYAQRTQVDSRACR